MNYVYIRSEPDLYTVGFYDPAGKWQPESDHTDTEAAARRVHFLNGGSDPELLAECRRIHDRLARQIESPMPITNIEHDDYVRLGRIIAKAEGE